MDVLSEILKAVKLDGAMFTTRSFPGPDAFLSPPRTPWLRIFCQTPSTTCCHPALSPKAQTAMTLREVCGLSTEQIARAFLTKPATVAQRIERAKTKIRETRIPYEVPPEKLVPIAFRFPSWHVCHV